MSVVTLTPQPSSARNLALSNDKLKKLGWHRPGERDTNSATAHLLSYLLRARLLPTDLLNQITPEEVDGGVR